MALEMTSNPKYKLICQRLAKFRAKPSIADLLDSSVEDINKIFEHINTTYNNLTQKQTKNILKRDWALYWKDSSNISMVLEYFSNIKLKIAEHYDQYKIIDLTKAIFGLIMKLFDTNNLSDMSSYSLSDDNIKQMLNNLFS